MPERTGKHHRCCDCAWMGQGMRGEPSKNRLGPEGRVVCLSVTDKDSKQKEANPRAYTSGACRPVPARPCRSRLPKACFIDTEFKDPIVKYIWERWN